jgi:hypothetical protein
MFTLYVAKFYYELIKMKFILLNLVLGVIFCIDQSNIVLREIETFDEDQFSFIVNNEIKKYYNRNINIYVSVIEDFDNSVIIDNTTQYPYLYEDVFGFNKTFFKRRNYENETLIDKIVNDDINIYILRNHFAGHFGCDLGRVKDLTWLDFYDINIANCEKSSDVSVIYSDDPTGYVKNMTNILKLKKIEEKRRLNKLIDIIQNRKVNKA